MISEQHSAFVQQLLDLSGDLFQQGTANGDLFLPAPREMSP